MDVNTLKSVYFIGAGGIGMSALVRYFLSKGKKVGGYDRTPSELTEKLIEEGAAIHYEENTGLITDAFRNPATTLVVYTRLSPTHIKSLPISGKTVSRYINVRRYWECLPMQEKDFV